MSTPYLSFPITESILRDFLASTAEDLTLTQGETQTVLPRSLVQKFISDYFTPGNRPVYYSIIEPAEALPEAQEQKQLLADIHIGVCRAQGVLNEVTALIDKLKALQK